jgi:hypothetical protein
VHISAYSQFQTTYLGTDRGASAQRVWQQFESQGALRDPELPDLPTDVSPPPQPSGIGNGGSRWCFLPTLRRLSVADGWWQGWPSRSTPSGGRSAGMPSRPRSARR